MNLGFILENPLILLIIGVIFIGIIINLVTSGIKKGGTVAVQGGVSIFKSIFNFILKIFKFCFEIIKIIYLGIILLLKSIFRK